MTHPTVQVSVVYAFSTPDGGGNPAGVVLDADLLSAEQKQAVAAAVGLSETAFVSSSTQAEFKLDFFTPQRQIAHCGHATIAAFSLLVQRNRLQGNASSKETIDGRREIQLNGDRVFMEQRAPRYVPLDQTPVTPGAVLDALGLTAEDLLPHAEPMLVNTGNSFVLVPVRSDATLRALQPNQDQIGTISEALDLVGVYPFTLEVQDPGRDAAARMFAPRYGIPEEAATGMAAGPLGAYLYDVLGVRSGVLRVEQGGHMTPPSLSELEVRLETTDGRVSRLMVGGRAREAQVMAVPLP